MAREVSNRCVACGFGFFYGPVFTDFITIIHQHGFRRTYKFDYRLYAKMFGHETHTPWPADVGIGDCDSMFLGCVIDADMKCPKCGQFAFPDRAS
jgi:hypothetical protein